MAVFSVSSIKAIPKNVDTDDQRISRVSITPEWEVSFDRSLITKINSGKWIFVWYGEYNTLPDLKRVESLIESGHLTELWGFRGILLAISQVDRCLYIFSDYYGAFPVYLNDTASSIETLASDSLLCFPGHKVDWTSFYQFLSFGYVFAPHSLLDGVSRLSANYGVRLAFTDESPVISQFTLNNFWNPGTDSNQASIDDLVDILREEAEGFSATQLMMSGGWDSRLLLAALSEKKPLLYTHGNLQSREIAIVRDIASTCNLPLVEKGFSQAHFGKDLFEEFLWKNESAMFTHWNEAGVYADCNQLVMTAGTFGEVLGGHYGTLNTLPGKKKYASLLMHMIGAGFILDNALHLHDKQTVLSYLKVSSYRVFWFLNQSLGQELSSRNLVEASNERLDTLFKTYEEEGIEDAQSMFERFYTEHRGGQYINRQLTNSARNNNFRNVFTNKELIRASSSIPFSRRAHNKLNKEIIGKINPKLLDFPMAATLAKAGRPLLVQEVSRAVRKIVEANSTLYSLYYKASRYGDRSFGWNDFGDIVDGKWVEGLTPLLSERFWDQCKLIRAVESDGTENMYPMFDMISKAVTLNYLIAGSA